MALHDKLEHDIFEPMTFKKYLEVIHHNDIDKQLRDNSAKLRYHLYTVFEFPHFSPTGKKLAQFVAAVTVMYLVSMTTQTIPAFFNVNSLYWVVPNSFCTLVFLLELSLRFYACPIRRYFFWNWMNIMDLLGLTPLFLELVLSNGKLNVRVTDETATTHSIAWRAMRAFRVLRFFRVLKLGRYNEELYIFHRTFSKSIPALVMVAILSLVGAFVFGALLYQFEVKAQPRKFSSIPEAMWCAIVTLTTVGYGDLVPITNTGRFVGAVGMLMGAVVIKLPVTIMGATCVREYIHYKNRKRVLRLARSHSRKIAIRRGIRSFDESIHIEEALDVAIREYSAEKKLRFSLPPNRNDGNNNDNNSNNNNNYETDTNNYTNNKDKSSRTHDFDLHAREEHSGTASRQRHFRIQKQPKATTILTAPSSAEPSRRPSISNARRPSFLARRPSFASAMLARRKSVDVPESPFTQGDVFQSSARATETRNLQEFLRHLYEEHSKNPAKNASSLRLRTRTLLENPRSSRFGRVYAATNIAAIIISVVVLCMQTIREFASKHHLVLSRLETSCLVVFTADILLRIATVPSFRRYATDFMTYVDLLSVIPFFISIFAGFELRGLISIRALRILRISLFTNFSKYNNAMRFVMRTLAHSWPAIYMLMFVTMAQLLFGGAIFYELELGSWNGEKQCFMMNGHRSVVQSIPDAFWFVIVTIATVGYGDVVPATAGGKIVGGILAVSGVVTLTLPVTIIGANFSALYEMIGTRQSLKRKASFATAYTNKSEPSTTADLFALKHHLESFHKDLRAFQTFLLEKHPDFMLKTAGYDIIVNDEEVKRKACAVQGFFLKAKQIVKEKQRERASYTVEPSPLRRGTSWSENMVSSKSVKLSRRFVQKSIRVGSMPQLKERRQHANDKKNIVSTNINNNPLSSVTLEGRQEYSSAQASNSSNTIATTTTTTTTNSNHVSSMDHNDDDGAGRFSSDEEYSIAKLSWREDDSRLPFPPPPPPFPPPPEEPSPKQNSPESSISVASL